MLQQDLRFAWRTLRRRPAFTAIAVLTLALGLGANTAMFSVIRAVLLRPLPYPSPEALVRVAGFNRGTGEPGNLSPADFMDLAGAATTLRRAGAHGWIGYFTVGDETGQSERVGGVNVTEGYFPTLGARFALGRAFTADEDTPDAAMTAILSHGFWQRRYGGDPAIVGRTIALNARPAVVVGVLAADFRHVESNPEREAEVFVPYGFSRVNPNRGGHFIRAVGRMTSGATVEQARAELTAIAARLEAQYPVDNTNQSVTVQPLHEAMVAQARPALLLLGAAVAFVLLVACANLANLLLAQGASRATELGVRAAMGAGRTRLVRQLLTESVLLSSLGAAAGIALALFGTRMLAIVGTADIPRAQDIRVDGGVLAFAVLLALVVGMVSGLLPAWQIVRRDLHAVVKDGARGQARPGLHRPARELLIASQVALALVLLAGAGLMVRSLWQLMHVDTGFVREQVLTFETAVPTARYAEGDQIPFYDRFYDAIRAQPGVQAVGAINILPLSANYDGRGIQIESAPMPEGQAPSAQARSISPDYFRAMGIPVVRGRAFTDRDRGGQALVMIVSESMARRFWPGQDPIGQRVTFNSGIPREQQRVVGGPGSREVVGVVGDVKHLGMDEDAVPMFYTPQAQQPSYHTMAVVVRTTGDPAALTGGIRQQLAALDRNVPLYRVRTLDTVVRMAVAAPALRAWLFGLFAALALVLAAIGVYGVVGYLVSQRTHEIGIRLALGAARGQVLRAMMLEGLRPVIAGVAVGAIAAVAAGHAMSRLLFGVTPADATTYVAMAGLLLGSAAVATWLPARRALRVDPMRTLRGIG
jgi:putative ABC transport system permease protein